MMFVKAIMTQKLKEVRAQYKVLSHQLWLFISGAPL